MVDVNILAKKMLSNAFEACDVKRCKNLSLGFVCETCSKRVCQQHALLRPSMPPRPVCVCCVVDEYQAEQDRRAERRKKRSA